MWPTSYRVRDVIIAPNVVLAPMEGVTDLTFRRLIRQIGDVGLTCTEFVSSQGMARDGKREQRMAQIDPDERPVSIQVYGNDPRVLAEAARRVQDLGPTLVDLNMGCPSKKVCAHSGGSALLKEPSLIARILREMRAALQVPFTAKMRTGFDPSRKNVVEVARMCESEGVEAITIHWRTRQDLYGGERDVEPIALAKQAVRIPVVANGDITDIPSALRMLEETGADGLMVGRGAMKNPWVIKQIAQHLRGETPIEVTPEERRRVLLGYFAAIRDRFDSDVGALGRFKKIANHFTTGIPCGADVLRTPLLRSTTPEEAIETTERFFDWLRECQASGREPRAEESPWPAGAAV